MSLYIVVHALKIDSEQFSEAMAGPDTIEFAKAMSSGQTPAKMFEKLGPYSIWQHRYIRVFMGS